MSLKNNSFSELTSSFLSLGWWTDGEDKKSWGLNTLRDDGNLCCVKTVFLQRWGLKDSDLLKLERCEHRDDICRWRPVKVLIVYCAERPSEESVPFAWRNGDVWLLQLTLRIENFVEYWRDLDFASVSINWWISDMNVKLFFCPGMEGITLSVTVKSFCFSS